jgi:hypothetical protein
MRAFAGSPIENLVMLIPLTVRDDYAERAE